MKNIPRIILLVLLTPYAMAENLDYEAAYRSWKDSESQLGILHSKAHRFRDLAKELQQQKDQVEVRKAGLKETIESETADLNLRKAGLEALHRKRSDTVDGLALSRLGEGDTLRDISSFHTQIESLAPGLDYIQIKTLPAIAKSLRAERDKAAEAIVTLNRTVDEQISELKKTQDEFVNLKQEKEQLEKAIVREVDLSKLETLKSTLVVLLKKIEVQNIYLERLETKLASLAEQRKALQATHSEADQKLNDIIRKLPPPEVMDKIEKVLDLLAAAEEELIALRTSITNGEASFKQLTTKILSLEKELADLNDSIQTRQKQYSRSIKRLDVLDRMLAEAKENYQQTQVELTAQQQTSQSYHSIYLERYAAYEKARLIVEREATADGKKDGSSMGASLASDLGELDGAKAGLEAVKFVNPNYGTEHARAVGYNSGLEKGLALRESTHPEVRSEDLIHSPRTIPQLPLPTALPKRDDVEVDRRNFKPRPRPKYPHPNFPDIYRTVYEKSYIDNFKRKFFFEYKMWFFNGRDAAFSNGMAAVKSTPEYNKVFNENQILGQRHGFWAPSLSRPLAQGYGQSSYCSESLFVGFTLKTNRIGSTEVHCQGSDISWDRYSVRCGAGTQISRLWVGRSHYGNIHNLEFSCGSGKSYSIIPNEQPLIWEQISCPPDKSFAGVHIAKSEDGIDDLVGICHYGPTLHLDMADQ